MGKYSHNLFMCGHFACSNKALELSGWERVISSGQETEEYSQVFYPEFVRAYLPNEASHIRHYRYSVQQGVPVAVYGGEQEILVKEIVLYVTRYNIAMFSVELLQESDDMNVLTMVLSLLRSPAFYKEAQAAFAKAALEPVMEAYKALNSASECHLQDLVENGNKFKVFQIINSQESVPEYINNDNTLFELGTVARVTLPGEEGLSITRGEYIERMTGNNKVAVFKNWHALALMDTFTVFAEKANEPLVGVWGNAYFRLIYMSRLFQKCYLFSLNKRFRAKGCNVAALENEYRIFERECCFKKISYNFLPLEIDAAIDKGLEVNEEREFLHNTLETEYERRRSNSDKMENAMLLVLSLMTVASALWDLTSLMNEVYPYAEHFGTSIIGHRVVISVAMAVIAMLTFFIYKKR